MNHKKVKKEGLRKGGFTFKQFFVAHDKCAMKVGTDGVLLGAWAPIEGVKTILDIGTGSGLITLMLAQRAVQAEFIDGIELDEQAALQAMENAQGSLWDPLIHIHHCDIYHYAQQTDKSYDLIVSNPPYFEPAVACRDDVREQARYTKTLTHDGLLDSAQALITENGVFCVVLPYFIGEQFIEIAQKKEWVLVNRVNVKDSADKPYHRILLAFQRQNRETINCSIDELIIRNSDGHYTDEFRTWVTDFYLYY
ncbi:putative O-methyltransferase [Proteus hauseri ATCC 700826]|uniref:tRNA1(Val) (adenine(37)-N6)-methyltransferase n=1 Tax=Proteus hauseri ATCC 700826 TaxID=1354271 RepID=A0AAJ3HQI6_PROHU|nr:tRNA1(Val) (adenine(37)-N6)-methyltransferase [Proteus hauseri]OAT45518.1 putative O-methyltransferase [Proteus hauseri ATCC 700826]